MKISVTGRHMEVSDVLREYAYSKVEHLTHYFDNVQKAEVVLNPEKDTTYSAELVIHAPRHSVLVGHASGKTATAAVDLVVEKLERLLTKFKEKLRRRNGKSRARGSERGPESPIAAAEAFGDIWW